MYFISNSAAGNKKMAPKVNKQNKKEVFEIPEGFFLTKTLYVPKQQPAKIMNRSPAPILK